MIAEAANWAGGAVVESAARLIGSARIYNLIVTNVPGPSVPLYLAGSRMREVYPHLPLFEQQGIGIALLSYVGRLAVCIAADLDLGGLLRDIARRLDGGLAELAAVAGTHVCHGGGRRRHCEPSPCNRCNGDSSGRPQRPPAAQRRRSQMTLAAGQVADLPRMAPPGKFGVLCTLK